MADPIKATTDAASNALSGTYNFVTSYAGKALSLCGAFLLVAALVTPAGAAPGIAAFAGKSAIGATDLGAGVIEGVKEGAGKIGDAAKYIGELPMLKAA